MRAILVLSLTASALAAGAAAAQARDSVVTHASITVVDPAQVRHDADLSLPDVARPAAGSTTATAAEGSYTLRGLGGETFNVSTPETVVLTRNGGTEEITLKLKPSQTVGAFAGPAGQPATVTVEVGGAAPVASDAKSGVYTGQYGVTVSYP
ncbi:DUF4402 domain-containing protein [Phenylobacterium sp.]|uniref:DUF4402 domain-containing protein n=1 Tax=Phenylobacterium sp. TaxID=1871053 RepID=UPI0035B4F2F3